MSMTMTAGEGVSPSLPPIIGTFSGGSFRSLEPREQDVQLNDIAHALSNICRYTGHVHDFWSVAAHCIEVSRRIEDKTGDPTAAMCGLLHDASEAYLVDVPSPLKRHFPGYHEREAAIEEVIAAHFKLPYPFPAVVKQVDKAMILDEVANFFPPGSYAWNRYGVIQVKTNLVPLMPKEGRLRFVERYCELNNRMIVASAGGA